MTRPTVRERWRCYRAIVEDGHNSRLDAFLLGFGLWIYFPKRFPPVDE